MLRPFLIVGVGGSGGKTLRAVRQSLLLKLQQEGWSEGWPEAWQFLHIDSPLVPDGLEFPAPLLPRQDYLSIVPSGVGYKEVYDSIAKRADAKYKRDIEKPLPSPNEVMVPIALGAGAYRAIGRTIAAAALSDIHSKAKAALTRMQTNTSSAQLSALTKHLGIEVAGKPTPTVILVSSIAGGSGAGMFIDVAEAVKSAVGGLPWADQMFSVLYAPDVFAEIGNMGAIAPNALGAIAETMSGYWNNNPDEATVALYKSAGVQVGNSPLYRVGPAFNYVVGRKNGSVDFGSQSGVYKAVSASIATWMTDDKIQDSLSAYAVANFAAKAIPLPDLTGFKRPAQDTPPFSSLGFARVSLGLERFFEYSSERLAKSTLETILAKHLEQDPLLEEKTEEQWREYYAGLSEGRFLADSGLNEVSSENNQVVDAIEPDSRELQVKLTHAITSAASQGIPKAGHDFNTWVGRICNAYELNLQGLLDELTNLRNTKARDWVRIIPDQLLLLVSRTIAQQGLPVTVELLKRTVEQCKKAEQELLAERTQHLTDAASVQVLVSQALAPAATMTAIPAANPAVAAANHQAVMAFYWRAQADLKQTGADLLADLTKFFLEPLHLELAGAIATLRDRVNDPKLFDGRENPYSSWPNFKQAAVPNRFDPAPNERLLVPTSEYASEFDRLITQTVADPALDAKRAVIDEMVMGSYGIEALKSLKQDKQWKMITVDQIWIPQNRAYQVREAAPQQARFSLLTDHVEYTNRAKLWLQIPGRSFNAYLDQTMATFLTGGGNNAEQSKRQATFLKEFEAAVSSAEPLVEINQALLGEVHTSIAGERSVVFSSIPVGTKDPLFEPLKDILVKHDFWTNASEGWFKGAQGAGSKREIDIFTQTGFPLQPVVMGSVMDPISKQWNKDSGQKISRTSFMKWRRGRSLNEAIPAHPEVWLKMLQGWYVMRLLNMFEMEPKDAAFEEKGPKLNIWIDPGTQMTNFPYPLYYPGIAPVSDLPGIVIESLVIAMANCYEVGSLKPLQPYQRLLKLGSLDGELKEWIANGKSTQPGAPRPLADRAGTPEMSFEERQARCIDFLQKELDAFSKTMSSQEEFGDVRDYPVSWEIREAIERAISEVIRSIKTSQPEATL